MKKTFAILFLVCVAGCGGGRSQLVRYPAVRWLNDDDRRPITKPATREDYKYWDIIEKHFFYPLEKSVDLSERWNSFDKVEALNVNNFDEVADSTWFTNRIGRHDLSVTEVARGPNRTDGPDPKGVWTILAAKTVGLTPGFLIKDSRGDRYLLKFDPKGFLELASGAEAISTRFFHAFGYHVPENSVVSFDRKILTLAPDATKKDKYGHKHPFTEEDLEKIFEKIEPVSEGRYRALASRLLEGEPLGPIPFVGRRRHDPNDRIPHQHRRELRGYRVFSAFLNHQDSREANTLDMFVETEEGKGFVKHHLIDFGGTLGSGGVRPKGKEHLYDYGLNYPRTLGTFAAVGFYRPYWEKAKDPGLPSIGMIESELFRPENWRPSYISPPFRQMTERDGFWAAKLVMRLSDKMIEAVVDEAKYSDPRARDYMIKVLKERRDKIGKYWFSKVSPLDNFALKRQGDDFLLSFEDLGIRSRLASKEETRYRWRIVDSRNGNELEPWKDFDDEKLVLPASILAKLRSGKSYFVQMQVKRDRLPLPPVDALVEADGGDLKLVGLRRH